MVDVLVYALLSLPLVGAYAILAIGLVVIFRASRVLNLAHGAMAMLPAYLMYDMTRHGLPRVIGAPLAIAAGALLGVVTERVFVRPLRRQGPTAQTVGTVAMFGLVVSLVAKHYGTTPLIGPRIFPAGGVKLPGSELFYGDIGLFATAVVVSIGLLALFRYTDLGLALRGAADNRVAAALVGIDPDRGARTAWLIGGGLAGLAGVILGGVNNLSPYTLSLQMLPAFVAALIGGLASIPGALVGAMCVGLLQGLVPAMGLVHALRRVTGQLGLSQLVLTIIALTVMSLRGNRYSSTDIRAEQSTGSAEFAAGRRRFRPQLPVARRTMLGLPIRTWRYLVLAGLLCWPLLSPPFSLLGDAAQAGLFLIGAASIVLLTGWVGQISLGQAAFVGIGAFSTAILIRRWDIPFPVNLLAAGAIAAAAAVVLGLVALRVRGLYLAVATLIFAYMADSYLFVAPWFTGSGGSSSATVPVIGHPGTLPFFDFSDRRTFYYVVLAVCAAVVLGLLNLRDSKTGRAFFAIRGSETAAASLGIDVRRYKLLAFGLAGGIAGVGGNLTLINQGTVVSAQFAISASLLLLAIAVVGGLQSLGGCVASSILFAGLNELFFRVRGLTGYLDVVSALLLAVVLLVYPGGLAAAGPALSRRVQPWLVHARGWQELAARSVATLWSRAAGSAPRIGRNRPGPLRAGLPLSAPVPLVLPTALVVSDQLEPPASEVDVEGEMDRLPEVRSRIDIGTVVDVRDVSVRFGGLQALAEVNLRVGQGEIVGLIGPNGAGKTTLFNAVSGLVVPDQGSVELLGHDVTAVPVHERAALGLGRTFQAVQLFPQLSVYENLLVATHSNNPSGVAGNAFVTRRSIRHEAAAEDTVRRAVRFLGLEAVADSTVAGLPFGVLRRVEIARTLVTGSPVVMLDEPASGLDNAETDLLSELLGELKGNLGLSLLLIEHDVRMVTAVSDRMYVLVHGRIVAEGTPAEVRDNPVVVAAYLGESAEQEVAV